MDSWHGWRVHLCNCTLCKICVFCVTMWLCVRSVLHPVEEGSSDAWSNVLTQRPRRSRRPRLSVTMNPRQQTLRNATYKSVIPPLLVSFISPLHSVFGGHSCLKQCQVLNMHTLCIWVVECSAEQSFLKYVTQWLYCVLCFEELKKKKKIMCTPHSYINQSLLNISKYWQHNEKVDRDIHLHL